MIAKIIKRIFGLEKELYLQKIEYKSRYIMADNKTALVETTNHFLFNFQGFIEELRSDKEKKKTVEDYEKYVLKGKRIEGDVRDQKWYKEYLSKFVPVPKFHISEELEDDFDWELLFQLVAGSFSSKYRLVYEESIPELYIWVQSGGVGIEKKISELWSFQIIRLFEIYCNECLEYETLKAEGGKTIDKDRRKSIRLFNKTFNPPAPRITTISKQIENKDNNDKHNENFACFYCSLLSAQKIIENGYIFASELSYMNDKGETSFGVDVLMKAIKIIAKKKKLENGFRNWLNDIINKEYEYRDVLEKIPTYISCFSTLDKLDNLAQWRAYGNNGNGVCLLFDFNVTLGDSLTDGFMMDPVTYINKGRVLDSDLDINKRYWKYEVKKLESRIHKIWEKSIRKESDSDRGIQTPIEQSAMSKASLEQNLDDSWLEVLQLARFYKNADFGEEKEFRILTLNNQKKRYEVKFRYDNNRGYIIPYVELRFGNERKETALKEIIIGPSVRDIEKTKKSFKMLFQTFNYSEVIIRESTIPYLP